MTAIKSHPQLSTLNDEVPLHITNLRLAPTQIELDTMTFTWGSILLHLNGQRLHPCIIDMNKAGGCPFDVNINGREIRDTPITEGDLQIFGKYRPPFEGYGRQERFDLFIRCCLNNKNGQTCITTVPNGKIYELMKGFLNNYLGGNHCHFVNQLTISELPGVHRLPAGLHFKVNELFVPGNSLEAIEVFTPIIHESSFPLNVLLVSVSNPRDPIFRTPIFKSANTVRLGMPATAAQQDWVPTLLHLDNQFVQLFEYEITFKQLFSVVRHWIQNPRPVDRKFATILEKVQKALYALMKVLNGNECLIPCRNTPEFCTGISFPVNDEVELNCYGVRAPGAAATELTYPFMMVMESMPRGTAVSHFTSV
uniref:Uncharacterized protein n=1 Tax=Caenorhabditis tropicalis TaxID=1561998 RepID=A0A1I7UGM6_9PELO